MLVEWVDQVPGAAPDDALRIRIEVISAQERRFTVTTSGPRSEALLARWLPHH
jgi:tRNA threonylcarbamoyladenosine biosynthesis protein TsaE